jgi:hypothetical protein
MKTAPAAVNVDAGAVADRRLSGTVSTGLATGGRLRLRLRAEPVNQSEQAHPAGEGKRRTARESHPATRGVDRFDLNLEPHRASMPVHPRRDIPQSVIFTEPAAG